MARKTVVKPQSVTSISGNKAKTVDGSEVAIPTFSQLKKKYGSLVDDMECPRTRIEHAKKALSYGLVPTIDCDGLIGISGWDWKAKKPIALSVVSGMPANLKKQAIAMMNSSGFMARGEAQSAKGLVTDEVSKLY